MIYGTLLAAAGILIAGIALKAIKAVYTLTLFGALAGGGWLVNLKYGLF